MIISVIFLKIKLIADRQMARHGGLVGLLFRMVQQVG